MSYNDQSNPAKLDTTQPEQLVYENGGLKLTVLGGIRPEGLETMRATIKAEAGGHALRHNLDLYNDTQLSKLTRRIAERMEIGTSVVNEVLAGLIEELETYRLQLTNPLKNWTGFLNLN